MIVDGELTHDFATEDKGRQGCVTSPWFNIVMDGCMREMKAKMGKNRYKTELG